MLYYFLLHMYLLYKIMYLNHIVVIFIKNYMLIYHTIFFYYNVMQIHLYNNL